MNRLLLSFALLFLVISPSFGADLLAGQTWDLAAPPGSAAFQTVPQADAPGGNTQVERITVTHASDPYWDIEITHTLKPPVPVGDQLRLHFWARSASQNPVRAIVEQAAAPYATVLQRTPTLTPQWTEYTITATLAMAYGANGLGVRFQMGQKIGVVELAGITLDDLGQDPAITAAKKAILPAAVQARIRRYRMANLTVLVRDAQGHPVPQARVHFQMTRHAFLFGSNLFGLNTEDHSPLQIAYQKQFAALFNYATLPFYWGAFEPTRGKPNYPHLDEMAAWCAAHGITPKGHPLVWHQVWPSWAPKDADSSIPLLHKRVTDIVTHYRGLIHYFDVVNEANSPDVNTGEGAWIQRDGAAHVVGTALAWARAAGRGEHDTFVYNDYDTGDDNIALLTQLQKTHQLPDAIGIQSHMHGGVWPLTKVWAVCQRFSQFGIPLHFTEITVLSGPARVHDANGPSATDWLTTPAGEGSQADYVTQFYTLLFSYPALRAITWWDFSDLNAWQGAPAGLLRKDMTPKPVYTRLMALIHHTWWTDVTVPTNHAGRATVHAFYGDYILTVTDTHGHTVTKKLSWPEDSGPRQWVLTIR